MSAFAIQQMLAPVAGVIGDQMGKKRSIDAVTEQLLANDWADRNLVAGDDTRKATRKEAKRLLRLGEIAPTLGASVGARDVLATGPADDTLRRDAHRKAIEAQVAMSEFSKRAPEMMSPTFGNIFRSMVDLKQSADVSARDALNRPIANNRMMIDLLSAIPALAGAGRLSKDAAVDLFATQQRLNGDNSTPYIVDKPAAAPPSPSIWSRLFPSASSTPKPSFGPDGRPITGQVTAAAPVATLPATTNFTPAISHEQKIEDLKMIPGFDVLLQRVAEILNKK